MGKYKLTSTGVSTAGKILSDILVSVQNNLQRVLLNSDPASIEDCFMWDKPVLRLTESYRDKERLSDLSVYRAVSPTRPQDYFIEPYVDIYYVKTPSCDPRSLTGADLAKFRDNIHRCLNNLLIAENNSSEVKLNTVRILIGNFDDSLGLPEFRVNIQVNPSIWLASDCVTI